MPPTTPVSALTMVVTNSERLEGRSTGSHVFHGEGGTLGSGQGDHWLLQDSHGQIRPAHAEIRLFDGRFCLIDRSGHTFINHATLPIGRDRQVALRDGDELSIGEYRVRIHYGDRQNDPSRQALDALVQLETPLLEDVSPSGRMTPPRSDHDPLTALGEATPGAVQQDPITALDDCESTSNQKATSLIDMAPSETLTSTTGQQIKFPSSPGRPYEENDMDPSLLDDLERSVGEQLEDRWQTASRPATTHAGAAPLLRGLGCDLPMRDSEEQQAFLEEAGRTLRATLEGLLQLHQEQSQGRYPLRDRRLQPIEDNPLRLDQNYTDTVGTLFSNQRSPVHLAPPAAVAECLAHQRQHQVAIEDAIGQALSAILDAFAPETMLKRFHAYRRNDHCPEDESGWAWNMYHHYYRELNSDRQRGFEKLFWEVFEQAYDGSIRRQQREGA